MADTSIARMDRDLKQLRQVGEVPDRGPDESFRTYFGRVAPAWLEAYAFREPHLAASVQRLLNSEARRHRRPIGHVACDETRAQP